MLLSQYLCGSHDGTLASVPYRNPKGGRSYYGFSRANVPLKQPAHGVTVA
jgi:hypothetical protein